MEIAQGVHLHVIKTQKFKTTQITVRFSGKRSPKNLAARVLVGQMLAIANQTYPTTQAFREKLASLYGASLSTKLATKGLVHMVDIDMSVIGDQFALTGEKLLEEVIAFLKSVLFHPLVTIERYQYQTFDIEKANLLAYLEADHDDSFYHSNLEINKLFYRDPALKMSRFADVDSVYHETSFTAYQEFQRMLREDQIDIFVAGDVDEYRLVQLFHQFSFVDRSVNLTYSCGQDYSNITQNRLERRDSNQSVLQLAYHFPIFEQLEQHFAMIVFNGMLGGFSHSKLFTVIRETEGLAYHVGSDFDPFTGLLKVYAGIDKENRDKTFQLINKIFNQLKMGRFSSELIQQTKRMLITNAKLADDSPSSLIDLAYNQAYMKDYAVTLDQWIAHVGQVTKEDIVTVAGKVKLQAVYFLEGGD